MEGERDVVSFECGCLTGECERATPSCLRVRQESRRVITMNILYDRLSRPKNIDFSNYCAYQCIALVSLLPYPYPSFACIRLEREREGPTYSTLICRYHTVATRRQDYGRNWYQVATRQSNSGGVDCIAQQRIHHTARRYGGTLPDAPILENEDQTWPWPLSFFFQSLAKPSYDFIMTGHKIQVLPHSGNGRGVL